MEHQDGVLSMGTDGSAAGETELYTQRVFPEVLTWQRWGILVSGAGFRLLGALRKWSMCALCLWGGPEAPTQRLQGL